MARSHDDLPSCHCAQCDDIAGRGFDATDLAGIIARDDHRQIASMKHSAAGRAQRRRVAAREISVRLASSALASSWHPRMSGLDARAYRSGSRSGGVLLRRARAWSSRSRRLVSCARLNRAASGVSVGSGAGDGASRSSL